MFVYVFLCFFTDFYVFLSFIQIKLINEHCIEFINPSNHGCQLIVGSNYNKNSKILIIQSKELILFRQRMPRFPEEFILSQILADPKLATPKGSKKNQTVDMEKYMMYWTYRNNRPVWQPDACDKQDFTLCLGYDGRLALRPSDLNDFGFRHPEPVLSIFLQMFTNFYKCL